MKSKRDDMLGGSLRNSKRVKKWLTYDIDSHNGAIFRRFDGVEVCGPVVDPRDNPHTLHDLADELGVWMILNLWRSGCAEFGDVFHDETDIAAAFISWWKPTQEEMQAYHPAATGAYNYGGGGTPELFNIPPLFAERGGFYRNPAI